jgi:hypothetical protein
MKILKTVLVFMLVASFVTPSFAMDYKPKAKAKTSKRKSTKKRKSGNGKVLCCAHYETTCPWQGKEGSCSRADWKKRWVSKAHLNRYVVHYK